MDLQRIHPLRGAIQCYAWGSRTALAELLGEPAPSPEPQAELWLGAHPRAPTSIALDTGSLSLAEAIERAPEAILGRAVAARFGPRLPFLLKVLAVERPLSIQAHPDAAQAKHGHAREEARGVPLAASERRYPDPHAKPELVCALGDFSALCGFRPAAEIAAGLDVLGLGELASVLWPRPGDPSGEGDAPEIRRFFQGWFASDARSREEPLQRAAAAAGRRAERDPACAWVARLAAAHPGDAGVLAPIFLNLIALRPGQALFLSPGELHCYLEGTAVEIMASSDNVLRGGLTPKHVDLDELSRVARFASRRPLPLEPEAPPSAGAPNGASLRTYRTPAAEFELSVLEPAAGRPVEVEGGGIELLLCERGRVEVAARAEAGPGLALVRGASCLVPAAVGPYRVEGDGRVFRAAVPAA